MNNAPFVVKLNKLILVYIGQGEGDTKWKGWFWKLLLTNWVMFGFVFCLLYIVSNLKRKYLDISWEIGDLNT